jgi:hypothetical protein
MRCDAPEAQTRSASTGITWSETPTHSVNPRAHLNLSIMDCVLPIEDLLSYHRKPALNSKQAKHRAQVASLDSSGNARGLFLRRPRHRCTNVPDT